jgi:hypothetical protein
MNSTPAALFRAVRAATVLAASPPRRETQRASEAGRERGIPSTCTSGIQEAVADRAHRVLDGPMPSLPPIKKPNAVQLIEAPRRMWIVRVVENGTQPTFGILILSALLFSLRRQS